MAIGMAVKIRNAVVRRLRSRSGYSTSNTSGCPPAGGAGGRGGPAGGGGAAPGASGRVRGSSDSTAVPPPGGGPSTRAYAAGTEPPAAPDCDATAMPPRLAHLAINADDLDAAQRFYRGVLGLRFEEYLGPEFLRTEVDGLLVALQRRRDIGGIEPNGPECTFA